MRGVPVSPSPSAPPPEPAVAGQHYENFPVASWVCPPHLRAPIAAIYSFARTADDIADEGDASPAERLAQLGAYRADLALAARGEAVSAQWPGVFGPLARIIEQYALPESLLADLLSAFAQDIEKTRDASAYAGRSELLDYCARSANPVGRLLLHLYGVHDADALRRSDDICTALQLANFWQDLSEDLPRGRHYLPDAELEAHGLSREQLRQFRPLADAPPPPAALAMMEELVHWTRALMNEGAPLVHRLPGRVGWELRFVVQGGLAILDKIQAQGFDSFSRRPTVRKRDVPRMAWRALRM
ncbi:squalene synthase HpnC [Variovorax soli]|uniref:squalene synthase HpnC n=1 Tax=Variovorax soli TaxID=376815 RepID=UPI000A046731